MIKLTDDMRTAFDSSLADMTPVMVATASAAGVPDITFKGSAMIWDDEHAAFWERSHGTTESNLAENPYVTLLYWNPKARVMWKLWGQAELLRDGTVREGIMERTNPLELNRDPERKGTAVLVRVDKVTQGPNVLMER